MRRSTRLLVFAVTAIWWVRSGNQPVLAAPFPQDCNDVCTVDESCTSICYPDEISFENGDSITCYAWGVYAMPCCGDGVCSPGENASNCFADCHCGDGICDDGETIDTCPADCNSNGGSTNQDCTGSCVGETCSDCPQDLGLIRFGGQVSYAG